MNQTVQGQSKSQGEEREEPEALPSGTFRTRVRSRPPHSSPCAFALGLLIALLGGHAAAAMQDPAPAAPPAGPQVTITSPLGRTGMSGPVRIVARIVARPGTTLSPVQFFVDGQIVGEDKDGPPYAVEWIDVNPLEPRHIAVHVADSAGGSTREEYDLKPLIVSEQRLVSSVFVEPSVRTPAGRPVNNLTMADFQIFEDGVPQVVEIGDSGIVPATYTLLIDSSQSMSRRLDLVRDAAQQLPTHLRALDSITVVPFSTSIGTITGPTQDRDTIGGAIQAIRAGGGTAILDCLSIVAKQIGTAEGRQIIVLITDGFDENSAISVDDALTAVKSSKATVYVIAIGGVAGISLRGEEMLKRLAAQTGGRAFFPAREFQLADMHTLIAADVQQRYSLTYTPTNRRSDGTWRNIKVTTSNPENVVTARPGYTAPAPPPILHQVELTVRDLSRQHLDVTPADLAVFEDGVEQTIEGFEEALTPVSIMLVLDESGSMKKDASAAVAAARTFARQLPGKDRVGVTLFADRPRMVQDLTAVREWIQRGIDEYVPSGGTALYDALVTSLERLKKETEGRKAIVLVTDGRDENNPGTAPGSVHLVEDVLTMVQETGTTVYAVGLGAKVDRETLQRIANASNGEAIFSADVTELEGVYRRILENLRRRYVLSYNSTNSARDGKWRTIELRPKREGIAVEAAEDGYLAPTWNE